jgi:hypothetical protein
MKQIPNILFLICALSFCRSIVSADNSSTDRKPAGAGQFYPASKTDLAKMLKELHSKAVTAKGIKNIIALISPHAGYVYSGVVAASTYNQLDPTGAYDDIFILGPSHHVGFEGAAVYTKGNFITPLGTVEVDKELGERLMKANGLFTDRADAHLQEHSVEVQLPFLQSRLRKPFKIVPIVIGASNPQTLEKIAATLRPFLNPRNLFIISTDFSHYPSYENAGKVDKATAEAIISNSPDRFLSAIRENDRLAIPNLATSACGSSCILTLLYMTRESPDAKFELIQYRNSGDVEIGDKGWVVGYCAIAVSKADGKSEGDTRLSKTCKTALLKIARSTVEQYVQANRLPPIDTTRLPKELKTARGAFVTLNKNHALRGCIGRFAPDEPLYKVVQDMAVAAATQDYRFPPVGKDELKDLEVEISVLTPMRRVHSVDEIELGRHGIYLRKGNRSGTFLPQVATETGWSKEEFLGHCARDKAGIGWDGWKDAEIYVYEAEIFSEHEAAEK